MVKMTIDEMKKMASAALPAIAELSEMCVSLRVYCTRVVVAEPGDQNGFEMVLKPEEMKENYLKVLKDMKKLVKEIPVKPPKRVEGID